MPAVSIDGIELGEVLGRGGFGTVFRAIDLATGDAVAVKVFPGLDADTDRRLQREMSAATRLSDHPNIVNVRRSGVAVDGQPYLVMDLIPGGTLADSVRADGPWSSDRVIQAGVVLAGALETAHRNGVIHRDVKPANILLAADGMPILCDTGIASVSQSTMSRTHTTTVSGTVAHLAPEVLDGPAVDASDTWALASTMFFALAGRAPFEGDPGESWLAGALRARTAPLPDLRPLGAPEALADALETAMAKDPLDRYPTTGAFGAALRTMQADLGFPVTEMKVLGQPKADAEAATAPGLRRLPRPAEAVSAEPGPDRGRSRKLLLVGGAAAVVLAAAAVFFATSGSPAPDKTSARAAADVAGASASASPGGVPVVKASGGTTGAAAPPAGGGSGTSGGAAVPGGGAGTTGGGTDAVASGTTGGGIVAGSTGSTGSTFG
ncbi:MAG: protein kinase/LuxR family transcriptional regulator, partial [Frankiales bacterium]|nr:protein kinase/LuxR family transcriptional regulator [Frankiales bacterium]